MKILFAGTPNFAVYPLTALFLAEGIEVVGVITQEDKPQGRKKVLTPSPVKEAATQFELPVFQPHKIKEEVEKLKSFGADMLITCAYGQILTQEVIDCFPKGVWNIHAGLLPMYRGASPIQSAILNGEEETGVTIMQTVLGLDAGDILAVEKTKIGKDETAGELAIRLSEIAASMIVNAVRLIESGNYTLQPQEKEGVHVYKKITREQAKIDFTLSAKEVCQKIRAMCPEPTAYALLRGAIVNIYQAKTIAETSLTPEEKGAAAGEIISDRPKIGLKIRCGKGAIKVSMLQPSGSKVMTGTAFLNGGKGKKGEIFA